MPKRPSEDEVVGGVGQRARVAALVDVERDVPVHAEQGDEQRRAGDAERQGGPAGDAASALGECPRRAAGCRCDRAVAG